MDDNMIFSKVYGNFKVVRSGMGNWLIVLLGTATLLF